MGKLSLRRVRYFAKMIHLVRSHGARSQRWDHWLQSTHHLPPYLSPNFQLRENFRIPKLDDIRTNDNLGWMSQAWEVKRRSGSNSFIFLLSFFHLLHLFEKHTWLVPELCSHRTPSLVGGDEMMGAIRICHLWGWEHRVGVCIRLGGGRGAGRVLGGKDRMSYTEQSQKITEQLLETGTALPRLSFYFNSKWPAPSWLIHIVLPSSYCSNYTFTKCERIWSAVFGMLFLVFNGGETHPWLNMKFGNRNSVS